MRIYAVIILFFLSQVAYSQKGKTFPGIKGTTLDDQSINIPLKNDKYSIIAMAYDQDAEDQLKEWLNPIYDMFIKVEHAPGSFDMADLYDVNFTFIPLIKGFKKVANEFKKSTDKEFWPYVMDTEFTDIQKIQTRLGITNTKVPYFYVLNKEGVIVEVQSGKYSEAKMSKLEDAVE